MPSLFYENSGTKKLSNCHTLFLGPNSYTKAEPDTEHRVLVLSSGKVQLTRPVHLGQIGQTTTIQAYRFGTWYTSMHLARFRSEHLSQRFS